MKIGILQTGYLPGELAKTHGEYPEMFERLLEGHGFDYATWPVVDGKFPDSATECDGWLITGSRHGAYEDLPWIPVLEEFIRDVYAIGLPMVGVCFGHQIIAQALGGKVIKFHGQWGVGKSDYKLEDGRELTLLAMHQDQVVEIPEDASVFMQSDFCQNAGLVYGKKVWTVQPHPEFSAELTEDIIHARRGTVMPAEQADKALEILDNETDASTFAGMIADFFTQAREENAAA